MMRKYTGVEKTEVLTPEGHKKVSKTLRRVGKDSFQQLSDEEKKDLEKDLEFEPET